MKGVNFYGPHSEYIISGSDCGNIFLWDREAEKVVQFFHGDEGGVVSCYIVLFVTHCGRKPKMQASIVEFKNKIIMHNILI